MHIKDGPITYARRLGQGPSSLEEPARHKPRGRFAVAGAALLALVVHAVAGFQVVRLPEAASEPAPALFEAALLPVPDFGVEAFHPPLEHLTPAPSPVVYTEALPARESATSRRPAIAVMIDDVGLNAARTRRVIDLGVPITLSFLPYGLHVQELADEAAAAGHEVFLHLPMEPQGRADPGPDALLTDLSRAELMARTTSALDSFTGYTGINNHMGSRLTQDAGLMAEVMTMIAPRRVEFVDSLTSPRSVAYDVARLHGIPATRRDVFLDHDISEEEIIARLMEAEDIARTQGTAIAIAHPHDATMMVLQTWLADMQAQGFEIVPVSEIIRRRNEDRSQLALVATRS